MLRKVLSASLLLVVAAILRPSYLTAAEPSTPVAAAPGGEIPFEFAQGHLISVHGSVGSQTNLQFLVDFGTTYTLLDRTLVKELERGPQMDVTHFSNSIRASEVVVPELGVGNIVVRDFRAYLMDFSEMPGAPSGVMGVIGMDFLEQQNLTVDFGQMKILLGPTTERTGAKEHSARLFKCSIGYAVDSEWRGTPVKLLLSTGVEAVTLDQDRMREKPVKFERVKSGLIGSNFTATPVSVFETKEMKLNEVRLKGAGVMRKIDWPVATDELDGFLPMTALRAKRVTLDFGRGLLLWSGSLKFSDTPDRAERRDEGASPRRKS
jgi:hypothetical protein